jgi:hypothetical protein
VRNDGDGASGDGRSCRIWGLTLRALGLDLDLDMVLDLDLDLDFGSVCNIIWLESKGA